MIVVRMSLEELEEFKQAKRREWEQLAIDWDNLAEAQQKDKAHEDSARCPKKIVPSYVYPDHEWVLYKGFTEVYEYCKYCDKKREPKK